MKRFSTRFAALAVPLLGAALLVSGVAATPANAADPTITTDPTTGWQQVDKSFTLSGTGCAGTDATVVIQSGNPDFINYGYIATPDADGSWTRAINDVDESTSLLPYGGEETLYAFCVDENNDVTMTYDPVPIAVTSMVLGMFASTGQDSTVTGTGFKPGETVDVYFDGKKVGTGTTGTEDDPTEMQTTFFVDGSTPSGTYSFSLVGAESGRRFDTTLTVTNDTPTPVPTESATPLPTTTATSTPSASETPKATTTPKPSASATSKVTAASTPKASASKPKATATSEPAANLATDTHKMPRVSTDIVG